MLAAIRYGNLAVAFLLELCALGALGYWGFQAGSGIGAKLVLGIGAPLLAAIVWGTFVAPKAAVTLPAPAHLALQLVVFGVAAAALAVSGRPTWAWVFGLAVVANLALVRVLGQ